ncbi:MAG: hypothetical protein NC122_06935 [Faecalibacterium sp.]|nr:hypothetical protein [Ruminococcus sp.]MCM1391193.1 hypothetical protein [Ruminococcus sp.]MCM1485925.1 hypothetical protein [Faecalibacterium sp.]
MLGKLLKYELKHSARYVMLIYACAGVTTVFMLLGMLIKSSRMTVIGSMVLEFVGIAAIFMTLVSVIKNFYDTLYGSQGYLSFTLPVKCSTLLVSKALVSFFWIILSAVLMGIITLIILLNANMQSDGALDGVLDIIRSSGALEGVASTGMIIKTVVLFAVNVLLNILTFVGFVYFSVTLANTRALQKHPKLFGFIIFFASYGIANSISAKLTSSLPLAISITADNVKLVFEAAGNSVGSMHGIGGLIFMALAAVALLCVTGWIMEHKVNVK